MTSTLAAVYDRKREYLGSSFHGFYDDSLRELFKTKGQTLGTIKASELISQ